MQIVLICDEKVFFSVLWKPPEPVNVVLLIVWTVSGAFKGHGPDGAQCS